jgi:hypothetical protein
MYILSLISWPLPSFSAIPVAVEDVASFARQISLVPVGRI